MARRRKVDQIDTVGAVEAFIGRCYKEGQAMCIQPYYGVEYSFPDGSNHVFTEEVLEQMLETGRVKVDRAYEKFVNIMGIIVD